MKNFTIFKEKGVAEENFSHVGSFVLMLAMMNKEGFLEPEIWNQLFDKFMIFLEPSANAALRDDALQLFFFVIF